MSYTADRRRRKRQNDNFSTWCLIFGNYNIKHVIVNFSNIDLEIVGEAINCDVMINSRIIHEYFLRISLLCARFEKLIVTSR